MDHWQLQQPCGLKTMNHKLKNSTRLFLSNEDGTATVAGLSFLITGLMITGLALDQASGWKTHTQMQIAADAAALAGSANLDDPDYAQEIALETAQRNLTDKSAIQASDITLGHIDPDSLSFVSGTNDAGIYDAVHVDAARELSRGNALPTFLMHLVGQDSIDVSTTSVAASQENINSNGGFAGCEDAVFLTSDKVNSGGGSNLEGAVCIHGEKAVQTGGGDYYGPEVRFSSIELENINISTYSPDSITEDELKVARSMQPAILPLLDDMHAELWDTFWNSGATTYSGDLLPSFVTANGPANIVRIEKGHWAVQPGDLEENTIYVAKGGVQFAGDIDIDNIAIIADGRIGVGGGNNLSFDNIFFIGTQLSLAGNITWGRNADACEDDTYGVYLFGTESLSMGGWGGGATLSGVVGAAPRFNPGGSMDATGVYFESDSHMSIGGDLNIIGCGTTRSSEYTLTDTSFTQTSGGGSYLLR